MSKTTKQGINQVAFEGSVDPANVLEAALSLTEYTAAGAIAEKQGTVFLKTGTAGAFTLAAPTAGNPAADGDDGKRLLIVAEDAKAYTVTTPASKIAGGNDTATFGGAIGDLIELVAFGGVWYAANLINVSLSAV